MQPEFISVISTPASLRKPPSMPISPNSFSMRDDLLTVEGLVQQLLMRVVLPAPKKAGDNVDLCHSIAISFLIDQE